MKSIILSLIALFICSTSAVQFNRTCRFDEMRPRVKMNLNIRDYTGLWFEIKRYEAQDQFDMDCVTASYTEFNNGVNVTNVGWASDGRRISFDGRATVSAEGAATNRAMLEVSFFPGRKLIFMIKNYSVNEKFFI
jgi:lipocalin